MALDGVRLRLKDVTNTCKSMQRSLSILQCNGGKLEEAEDFKCVYRLLCVGIEMYQLQCVNC